MGNRADDECTDVEIYRKPLTDTGPRRHPHRRPGTAPRPARPDRLRTQDRLARRHRGPDLRLARGSGPPQR